MTPANILVYILRRDLRLEDNPIFHAATTDSVKAYTHFLPVYVFSAQQIEVSGFIPADSETKSPYPEAKSRIGKFWRCGPHRAKFMAESVWGLKGMLEGVDSGLEVRVGMLSEVLEGLLAGFKGNGEGMKVGAVWMTAEEGVEEKEEENSSKEVCEAAGVDFKLWKDEKYFIDEYVAPLCHGSLPKPHFSSEADAQHSDSNSDDVPFKDVNELPDVFTSYRKLVEPLRDAPRAVLPTPTKGSLPPLPPASAIPPQALPFVIPSSYDDFESTLLSPVSQSTLPKPPPRPDPMPLSPPVGGGSLAAHTRLAHLLQSGAITTYKDTRNILLGTDYSMRLSAHLSQGTITARQIHASLVDFESGSPSLTSCTSSPGFGGGDSDGTTAIRYELLWRDYMRLCTRKFGARLFSIGGFRRDFTHPWTTPSSDPASETALARFLNGTTGTGLIDASQRELVLTGYTSSRARQNVASFLAKQLGLDWRLGAEWYEYALVDYDVSSCWGNWQYVAGVGNDPRGEARSFNPIKQAWDYDPKGEYCRSWIVELAGLGEGKGVVELSPGECFQAWTMVKERQVRMGIHELEWVKSPLKPIEFTVGRKQRGGARRVDGVEGQGYRGARGGGRGVPHGPHRGRGGGYGGGGYNIRGDWNSRGYEHRRGLSPRGRGSGVGRGRGGRGDQMSGREEVRREGQAASANGAARAVVG